MPVRESKSVTQTNIDVIGRDSKRRGRLEITSGNLSYYRKGAKTETLRLTLQDLTSLLEAHIDRTNAGVVDVDDLGDRGFWLEVIDSSNGEDEYLFEEYCSAAASVAQLDDGSFQIDAGLVGRKKRERQFYNWYAQIPVSLAVQMVLTYIDKDLVGTKSTTRASVRTPIPKVEMKRILNYMLKQLE